MIRRRFRLFSALLVVVFSGCATLHPKLPPPAAAPPHMPSIGWDGLWPYFYTVDRADMSTPNLYSVVAVFSNGTTGMVWQTTQEGLYRVRAWFITNVNDVGQWNK